MKLLQEKINEHIAQRTLLLNKGLEKCLSAQSAVTHQRIDLNKIVYMKDGATLHSRAHSGIPTLLIPSHINKGYILDILPEYSLLQQLEDIGLHPYLLEWNQPIDDNMEYNLDDYIIKILIPMLEHIYKKHGRKVLVLGYCMGGICATAAAQLAPEMVAGLITIATPWNFHATSFPYKATENMYSTISNITKGNIVSKNHINAMIQWPHTNNVIDKFIMLATKKEASPLFIAVENWLDDGLSMTKPLFFNCLIDFLLKNKVFTNQWAIGGIIINPNLIKQPALCIIGENDNISPPASTLPLTQLLPNAQSVSLKTGHLGLIVSTKINVAKYIGGWIKSLDKYQI